MEEIKSPFLKMNSLAEVLKMLSDLNGKIIENEEAQGCLKILKSLYMSNKHASDRLLELGCVDESFKLFIVSQQQYYSFLGMKDFNNALKNN